MSDRAALLLNLGSPDSPSVPDVRRYLSEFLMDGRVLDAPFPIRWLIVHGRILPTRSKESAQLYESIWTDDGSPLIVTSEAVTREVQKAFDFPVALAMRYGRPSTGKVVRELAERGVKELLVFPLYPHYAMSSYETAVVKVTDEIARQRLEMNVIVVPPFFDDPEYIGALVQSAAPYLAREFDRLLFSFHGIPERHLRKTDPTGGHCLSCSDCCEIESPAHSRCYRHQCFQTVERFVKEASIDGEKVQISFQSRLGRDPWLTPYTDETLRALGRDGVKRVLVICPAFVSDCLETLEEIAIEGKETFLDAGGVDFQMIPCLNTHPAWIDFIVSKIGALFSLPGSVSV